MQLRNVMRVFSNFSKCCQWRYHSTNSSSGRIEARFQSLSSKGFLRPYKLYVPPPDVSQKVYDICTSMNLPKKADYKLCNLEEKYDFLNICLEKFKHSVPNSHMYELTTIADVIQFYETPVNTTTPYDALKQIDLPKNLHIQYDYVRFHPDNDTKFNGQTAFPKSSTLVTGLKYRGKYTGYEAKRSWP